MLSDSYRLELLSLSRPEPDVRIQMISDPNPILQIPAQILHQFYHKNENFTATTESLPPPRNRRKASPENRESIVKKKTFGFSMAVGESLLTKAALPHMPDNRVCGWSCWNTKRCSAKKSPTRTRPLGANSSLDQIFEPWYRYLRVQIGSADQVPHALLFYRCCIQWLKRTSVE